MINPALTPLARHEPAAAWTLEQLLMPLPTEAFLGEVYGCSPWHQPAAGLAGKPVPESLFNWDDLNALLAMQNCWSPGNFKLVSARRTLPADSFCQWVGRRNPVLRPIPAEVMRAMRKGATLVLSGVDGFHPGIAALLDDVESVTAGRGQANLYVSMAGHPGFGLHYDAHDTLVLQLAGAKKWSVHAQAVSHPEAPVPPEEVLRARAGAVAHTWTLAPGDWLYLPAGYCHEAVATAGQSMHLTLALKQATQLDIMHIALAYLQDHSESVHRPRYDVHRGAASVRAHIAEVLNLCQELLDDPAALAHVTSSLTAAHRARDPYALPVTQPV